MAKRPPFDKWNKCMNVDLKESKENLRFTFNYKFFLRIKQRELELEGCKIQIVLTILEKVEARARGF